MKGILMFKRAFLSFLITLVFPLQSHAFMDGCAKDIFKVGASFDSAVYSAEEDSKELDLVSDQGLGIYLNWIIYCPESGIEISPYFQFRNYAFEESDDFGKQEDIESFTIGFDIAKRTSIFGFEFDTILGLGNREDIIINVENGQPRKHDLKNNLITIGLRKELYKLFGARGGVKAHIGALFPDDDRVETGYTSRISTDLHYKLAKKYALILDLFYDYYDQDVKDSDLRFSRKEIGLGGYFLFRF
jgi:hypothetical protein